MKRILVVEDDRGLREGIELALRREDLTFSLCESIAKARKALTGGVLFDLILLDLNLPDGSGYELLKEVKAGRDIPVIIITANDMEIDEVRGLELGAEDYITKPFSLMVLRARIDKALKNAGKQKKEVYRFGNLSFCFEEMQIRRGEEEIVLSKTELKLLQVLVENQNIVMGREKLIDKIWTDGAEFVDENALSVAVGRLRSKLKEDGEGHLQTVYGIGYVWKGEIR
ncbi:MAG: response regulator transcription factor [Lachnospiraceae bacterium]|nr:response regulator transcription factor [Lachnospiraceae bacterium]